MFGHAKTTTAMFKITVLLKAMAHKRWLFPFRWEPKANSWPSLSTAPSQDTLNSTKKERRHQRTRLASSLPGAEVRHELIEHSHIEQNLMAVVDFQPFPKPLRHRSSKQLKKVIWPKILPLVSTTLWNHKNSVAHLLSSTKSAIAYARNWTTPKYEFLTVDYWFIILWYNSVFRMEIYRKAMYLITDLVVRQ